MRNQLRNSMKGLINKCFCWCHIRHLNLLKRHSERIAEADKNMINDPDCEGIKFPVSQSDYCKIEPK